MVDWQSESNLDSIRNSCDVFLVIQGFPRQARSETMRKPQNLPIGFHYSRPVFWGSRLVIMFFMIIHGSRSVFHDSRFCFMVFRGSRLVYIRAERRRPEVRHWEHSKRFPLDLCLGPTIPPARPCYYDDGGKDYWWWWWRWRWWPETKSWNVSTTGQQYSKSMASRVVLCIFFVDCFPTVWRSFKERIQETEEAHGLLNNHLQTTVQVREEQVFTFSEVQSP